MKKKIFSIILFLIILMSSTVFATTVSSKNATFEVVENNTCTIKITENSYFEKKMIDYDLDKKEVTIQLKVVNNEIKPSDGPCEIVLLIDNSNSMTDPMSTGGTRMAAIINSAKTLVNELMKNSNVKISVVSFSSANSGDINYTDPNWIDQGEYTDAKLRTQLTNSKDTVLNAITQIQSDSLGQKTDIDVGLRVASEQFSGTIDDKYIVLLTDGVPNLSYKQKSGNYEQVDIDNTKNTLINLNNNGITILSMMTGVNEDSIPLFTSETESVQTTHKSIAEAVFGTPSSPTTGKFYYITDNQIEETVTETILKDLTKTEGLVLRNLKIYDYFPQEIIDNFDFEYVQNPTKGTASEDISLITNSIVWTIDELGYGETATLSYKLKLKDNIDEKIISVILNTNDAVDIFTDNVLDDNGNPELLSSSVTPKVRVNIPTITPTPTDKTVATTPIPQAGTIITISLLFGGAVIAGIVIGIRAIIKSKNLK